MKKLIIIFSFLPLFVNAQTWIKTYGDLGGIMGNSVRQTNDGGFIVCGESASQRALLLRVDPSGETIWSTTFGDESCIGQSVIQTNDGGYALLINMSGGILFVRTDSEGTPRWDLFFGEQDFIEACSVEQMADGGFILFATSYDWSQGSSLLMIRTDADGVTLWSRLYNEGTNLQAYDGHMTQDGGFIAIGTHSSDPDHNGLLMLKTDSSGEVQWTKLWDETVNQYGFSGKQTADGGYIVTGSQKANEVMYLLKTDANGDLLWSKDFSPDGSAGYAVAETADGGFIIAGETSVSTDLSDVFLVRTNADGEIRWTRTFGGEDHDLANAVQTTTDGGFIVTGDDYQPMSGPVLLVIKTDDDGNISSTNNTTYDSYYRRQVKTVDLWGRELIDSSPDQPCIVVYDDGSTEKKLKLK